MKSFFYSQNRKSTIYDSNPRGVAANPRATINDVREPAANVTRGGLFNDAAALRLHAFQRPSTQTLNVIPVSNASPAPQEKAMKSVQIYDKPMCCSTGICGPDVDPVLPQFAADLDWLKGQGHQVERFNLAQQPQAFIENQSIHQLLSTEGTDCLPVVIVDGQIMSRQVYPSRDTLSGWVNGSPGKQGLPVSQAGGGCCGSTGCC